jgi:hypothetical protein
MLQKITSTKFFVEVVTSSKVIVEVATSTQHIYLTIATVTLYRSII